jgi:hypothetical protein
LATMRSNFLSSALEILSMPRFRDGDTLQGARFRRFRRRVDGVGVLRLRNCFASRSSYSAQDDMGKVAPAI